MKFVFDVCQLTLHKAKWWKPWCWSCNLWWCGWTSRWRSSPTWGGTSRPLWRHPFVPQRWPELNLAPRAGLRSRAQCSAHESHCCPEDQFQRPWWCLQLKCSLIRQCQSSRGWYCLTRQDLPLWDQAMIRPVVHDHHQELDQARLECLEDHSEECRRSRRRKDDVFLPCGTELPSSSPSWAWWTQYLWWSNESTEFDGGHKKIYTSQQGKMYKTDLGDIPGGLSEERKVPQLLYYGLFPKQSKNTKKVNASYLTRILEICNCFHSLLLFTIWWPCSKRSFLIWSNHLFNAALTLTTKCTITNIQIFKMYKSKKEGTKWVVRWRKQVPQSLLLRAWPQNKRKTGSKGNARARVALMIVFSSRKPFPSLQPTPASKGKHTAKPKIARIFLANLVLDFLPNPVGG